MKPLLLAFALFLGGCCAFQEEALLHVYKAQQQACLDDYADAYEAEDCVDRVRLVFGPIFAAYETEPAE